jgi:hypothetical protein
VSYTLEEKIEYATEKLAAAKHAQDGAELLSLGAHEMGGGIPGFGGSGSQRAANQVRSAWSRADKAAREADERAEYWAHKLSRYKARLVERDRIRLTRDDIKGASWIRTDHGWRKVVRVNAKTVSVESGYSWTDRIDIDRVIEVRA